MAVVWQQDGANDRDQEIAETIMLKSKPAGIEPHGSVSVEVFDSQGFAHTCRFTRPEEVPIYLELDLVLTGDYPDGGDDVLKEALVAWGNALGPGRDVIVYPVTCIAADGRRGHYQRDGADRAHGQPDCRRQCKHR